jgi:hypothetical protein
LIERAMSFGSFDAPNYFRSAVAEDKWINDMLKGGGASDRAGQWPMTDWYQMPQEDRARTAEATRRVAPDLLALNRYERRAVVRRDRAIRALTQRRRRA